MVSQAGFKAGMAKAADEFGPRLWHAHAVDDSRLGGDAYGNLFPDQVSNRAAYRHWHEPRRSCHRVVDPDRRQLAVLRFRRVKPHRPRHCPRQQRARGTDCGRHDPVAVHEPRADDEQIVKELREEALEGLLSPHSAMEKLSDILGQAITLLFQLVLAGILVGLLLGEAAGPLVGSVLANTKAFLSTLNPAAAAVLFVLYLLWRQFGGAT